LIELVIIVLVFITGIFVFLTGLAIGLVIFAIIGLIFGIIFTVVLYWDYKKISPVNLFSLKNYYNYY
jgi:hypothetical protein